MSQLEFGTSGWPPISICINPPPLGSNGLHCIEYPRKRGKHFLNLNLGSYIPFWRSWVAWSMEGYHKPVVGRVESVPPTLLSLVLTRHCVGTIVGEETVGRLVVVIDVNPSHGFWTTRLMKLFGHE
jgi:hypothetical protein